VLLQLIGTDGGLLVYPLDLNDGAQRPHPGSITIAPAERVDVLLDFRAFSGQHIELRNSATSPFDGGDADPDNPLAGLLAYPQVMCFDIGAPSERHQLLPWDQKLLPSAMPWSYDAVRQLKPVERLVALVENDQGVPQLLECAPRDDAPIRGHAAGGRRPHASRGDGDAWHERWSDRVVHRVVHATRCRRLRDRVGKRQYDTIAAAPRSSPRQVGQNEPLRGLSEKQPLSGGVA
jgi:hypothetical protein